MFVEILTEDDDTLEFQITGEGHTLMVALRNELFKMENVLTAGYSIEHPLSPNPKLYIKTNGKVSPRKVLKNACDIVLSQLNDFETNFQKAIK